MEILSKYHLKIKHISRTENTQVDTLSRKAELQGNERPLGVILKLNKNRKVRYNYLQLAGTHKALMSL